MRRNVTFRTSIQYDSLSHPVGEEVILILKELIDKELGLLGSVDNWRDCGWSIGYAIGDVPVIISLTRPEDERFDFYMQIAHEASLLKRIFKKIECTKMEEKVIKAVNSILMGSELFSEIRWHDKYYDKRHMTEEVEGESIDYC